jgi:hypothetical protein
MKFCPHCGKQLQFENAEICPDCGCRVAGPRAAPPTGFNAIVAVILVAILVVLCVIAAGSFLRAPDSPEKTVVPDTPVSLPDYGDSAVTADWNTMADWDSWGHTGSWSGRVVGLCSENGPNIVGGHGEYGNDVNLIAGSTESSVWHTFTDPSGNGWNTLTFAGRLSASDVPGGRWLKIEVNDQPVFQAEATRAPPGNCEVFVIPVHFPESKTVRVKISNGQSPAWGPYFRMEYYSLRLSRETGVGP